MTHKRKYSNVCVSILLFGIKAEKIIWPHFPMIRTSPSSWVHSCVESTGNRIQMVTKSFFRLLPKLHLIQQSWQFYAHFWTTLLACPCCTEAKQANSNLILEWYHHSCLFQFKCHIMLTLTVNITIFCVKIHGQNTFDTQFIGYRSPLIWNY